MKHNDDKEYKPIDNAFTREVRSDIEANMEKFRDPVVLGEMVYRLLEERENTNRLLKNILQKLEAIEAKMGAVPEMPVGIGEALLPEIDEKIMEFVKEHGKTTAEEVRARFNYRGKNAASARLNRLCDMNLLQKQQVGKKVYFFPL
jgi:predicted HTH transcriptional regulator